MNTFVLRSPEESIRPLAEVIKESDGRVLIQVREDKCFAANKWLNLGKIRVFPSKPESEESDDPVETALRFGSYSWTVPDFDVLMSDCESVLSNTTNLNKDKLRRALESVIACACRCGFVTPTFDAGSISDMPFSRPTTVVVDTSAVIQGGLDFVSRFLYPMARIKVPAIVHMEIVHSADRYFAHRRQSESKINCANTLFEHVKSQAAQRVLLRLELQTDTEIERPRLGADPLRGIISSESDAEDKALGLSKIQRSFADRLILETAIHHRESLSPDHPIIVLTADQGLARMTLAEGLQTLFFILPRSEHVCGQTLLATNFKPFASGDDDAPMHYIPLPLLMWELASTFGTSRIVSTSNQTSFKVAAIGEDLSWNPFHSRDDLLWTEIEPPKGDMGTVEPDPQPSIESTVPSGEPPLAAYTDGETTDPSAPSDKHVTSRTGSYRFSLSSMVALLVSFHPRALLSDVDGMRIVGLASAKRYADLRNFLIAGGFATKVDGGLRKTERLEDLYNAIKTLDHCLITELVSSVPTFAQFLAELKVGKPTPISEITSIAHSAIPTYTAFSEACCEVLDIVGEGLYRTPHSPPPNEFTNLALKAYRKLKDGETYILTGQWLEELARTDGIHPINSRARLNEARTANLLERYTEGSTPETQFERHTMAMFVVEKGVPKTTTLNLYHGDFLIPGKASVSIRLEEGHK